MKKGLMNLLRWIGALVIPLNVLAAGETYHFFYADEAMNLEAGEWGRFPFTVKEGDIVEITRYEERGKGVTTFLLDEDDFEDWRNGANAKNLSTYLYIPDNTTGEVYMHFIFIAPRSGTYYLVCDNRSAWMDNKVIWVSIAKIDPSASYKSALKKLKNQGCIQERCYEEESWYPVMVVFKEQVEYEWYWGPWECSTGGKV